jgi:hypothetical protein
MSPLTLIALTLFVVFAALAITFTLLNRALKRHLTRVYTRWLDEGVQIVKGPAQANYRGHLSMAIPVRGNGVIALTERDLRFAQFVPDREFIVPLDQITHLAVQRTWQGSTRGGQPVIGVYFGTDDREGDQTDAFGVIVPARERQAWIEAIAAAAQVPVEDRRG